MQALYFLINTLFTLFIVIIILRIWMQMARADFYNPVSQFVVKVTNPVLVPLRRFVPGFVGLDVASFILLAITMYAKYSLIQVLFGNGFPALAIGLKSLISIFDVMFSVIFWGMVIRAILSWVSQGYNPIEALLHQLTEPLLAPIRKFIPPVGGLDLSMLVFLIGMQFLKLLLVPYI